MNSMSRQSACRLDRVTRLWAGRSSRSRGSQAKSSEQLFPTGPELEQEASKAAVLVPQCLDLAIGGLAVDAVDAGPVCAPERGGPCGHARCAADDREMFRLLKMPAARFAILLMLVACDRGHHEAPAPAPPAPPARSSAACTLAPLPLRVAAPGRVVA